MSIFLQSRDVEFVKSQLEAEGRENDERRVQFASALKEEEQSKKKEKEALINDLVGIILFCVWHTRRIFKYSTDIEMLIV